MKSESQMLKSTCVGSILEKDEGRLVLTQEKHIRNNKASNTARTFCILMLSLVI